jgi:formiminotetrahydrofolate cyclodeaminase
LGLVPLADRTLAELLDEIAARSPAPGGGSAAAVTAATAAALVEMAAAFAPRGALGDRAAVLRAHLLELADADTRSYQAVLAALSLGAGEPGRAGTLAAALSAAAQVPLAIAAAGAEVAELAAGVALAGNAHLLGDATAAAVLAEGAARAAARLVELNLAGAPDDPRLREAGRLVERAWAGRAAALGLLPDDLPAPR